MSNHDTITIALALMSGAAGMLFAAWRVNAWAMRSLRRIALYQAQVLRMRREQNSVLRGKLELAEAEVAELRAAKDPGLASWTTGRPMVGLGRSSFETPFFIDNNGRGLIDIEVAQDQAEADECAS